MQRVLSDDAPGCERRGLLVLLPLGGGFLRLGSLQWSFSFLQCGFFPGTRWDSPN
ncbi:hypothetical protein KSP40_PGU022399 [Platanthera guangdongensis]|uniref:Uncharacterized protein n=1 Tax=Platanthera guangdongensis TaxID=2320717 RepID=A0ABR2MVM4_9ASPA